MLKDRHFLPLHLAVLDEAIGAEVAPFAQRAIDRLRAFLRLRLDRRFARTARQRKRGEAEARYPQRHAFPSAHLGASPHRRSPR